LAVADLDGCTMATADDLIAKVGKDLGIKVRWAGSLKQTANRTAT
jgi:hypothetical protein